MPKPWGQPNKLATGVLNAQGRINSNDLGQVGTVDPGDLSFGDASFGGTIEDGVITLQTDGTYDFGTKPTGPQALVVWTGDDGDSPNGELGRHSQWSVSRVGGPSSAITGEGTAQSWTMDHHDSSGTFQSETHIDSDEAYIFRRYYDDFTTEEAQIMRLRVSEDGFVGEFQEGETVVGQTSGVSGVIAWIEGPANGRYEFYFDATEPTFGSPDFEDFVQERIVGQTSGAEADTLASGDGADILRNFNNKILRLWQDGAGTNNIFVGEGPNEKITTEYTGGSHWANNWDNPSVGDQTDRVWIHDEYVYRTSDIDVQNGIFWRYKNGVKNFEDQRFTMRNQDWPNRYVEIHHHQVSNGATPGADRYMDLVYIDEDWCRVVLLDGPDLRLDLNEGAAIERTVVPCPVQTWGTDQIGCIDWRKYHPNASHIGVINSNNELVAVTEITTE